MWLSGKSVPFVYSNSRVPEKIVSDLCNEESKKGSWLSGYIGSHLEAQRVPGGGGGGGGGGGEGGGGYCGGQMYFPSFPKMWIDDNKDYCERVF